MRESNWTAYLPFKNAIVFENNIAYVFEYEEEYFDIRTPEGRRCRIVLERFPKRDWNSLREEFPSTIIHTILELYPLDIYGLQNNKRELIESLKEEAFHALKAFSISYRRISGEYINFYPLDFPFSKSAFLRNISRYHIIIGGQIVGETRELFLDQPLVFSVGKLIPEKMKVKIESYAQMLLLPSHEERNILRILEIFDEAIINFTQEAYHVSLILSVATMEAILRWFVFETGAKKLIIQSKIKGISNDEDLRREYKKVSGLITEKGRGKIRTFLFPLLEKIDKQLKERLASNIKEITEIYKKRSEVVHEGKVVLEDDALQALNATLEFIEIILEVAEKIDKKEYSKITGFR